MHNTNRNNDNKIFQRSLEEENSKYFEHLGNNVKELQNIGIEIRNFITNEKSQLEGMEDKYDSANSILTATMIQIQKLMNSKYYCLYLYIILIGFFIFLVLYFLKP